MAGGDLKWFRDQLALSPQERQLRFEEMIAAVHASILNLKGMGKPAIAAVHGAVAGFGMSLMMACDLVVAADNAYFTLAYSNIALSPDGGATWSLPRQVGLKQAMEIALLGDRFDAARALELGLLNRVVPLAQLPVATQALAQRLAAGPAAALARTKALLNQSLAALAGDAVARRAAGFCRLWRRSGLQRGAGGFLRASAGVVRSRLMPCHAMLIDTHCHLAAAEFRRRSGRRGGGGASGRGRENRRAGGRCGELCRGARLLHASCRLRPRLRHSSALRPAGRRDRPRCLARVAAARCSGAGSASCAGGDRSRLLCCRAGCRAAGAFLRRTTEELPVMPICRCSCTSAAAVDQVLKYLRRIRVPGGIAHAFNGSRQQAEEFIRLGFRLGFGGAMTYSGSTRIRQPGGIAAAGRRSCSKPTLRTCLRPGWRGAQHARWSCRGSTQVLAELRGIDASELAVRHAANARPCCLGCVRPIDRVGYGLTASGCDVSAVRCGRQRVKEIKQGTGTCPPAPDQRRRVRSLAGSRGASCRMQTLATSSIMKNSFDRPVATCVAVKKALPADSSVSAGALLVGLRPSACGACFRAPVAGQPDSLGQLQATCATPCCMITATTCPAARCRSPVPTAI
jgi:2-(1,2-epoxy-1,2-dihydrophenyl)acetyl-CoA isomerase